MFVLVNAVECSQITWSTSGGGPTFAGQLKSHLVSSIPKDHLVEHFRMSLHGLICVVISKHDVIEM